MIIEGIVTTMNPNGTPNLSPMGPLCSETMETFELRPFQGSRTLENLKTRACGVFHFVDDALLFAQGVLDEWTEMPTLQLAEVVAAPMLKSHLRAFEFETTFVDESANRATVQCKTVQRHIGQLSRGHCRGLHAVVEGAILISRLQFLPREEIENQMRRLQEIVSKTGSERDQRAWMLLQRRLESINTSESA